MLSFRMSRKSKSLQVAVWLGSGVAADAGAAGAASHAQVSYGDVRYPLRPERGRTRYVRRKISEKPDCSR